MHLYKSVLSVQLLKIGAQLHFVYITLNVGWGRIARPLGTRYALKDFLRRDMLCYCRVTTARTSYVTWTRCK